MISLRSISKDFYSENQVQRVLKEVNLDIKDEDFITIMGPSGGGKSTLLQIIALLTKPTMGEVYYGDKKINFSSERELNFVRASEIGVIFQSPNLISSLSPLENLIIAMKSKGSYKEKENIAKNFLDKVGLNNKYNSKVTSLSGGEAQRVSIARALVNDPKIILCDEPTGALDSVNSKKVLDMLLSIKKEKGCALIIVTHDREIGELGHKRIYLKDGEIYEMDRYIQNI